ncbi:MAG: tetratricopeptide repeat protein [Armatimonadota bacterium]|nr:tetratricopeptide repeat protein [Armatimonadota bacterium]
MSNKARSIVFFATVFAAVAFAFVLPGAGFATTEEDAQSSYIVGNEFAVLGQFPEAIQEWRGLLLSFDDQPRICANARLAIGQAYHSMGQANQARSELRDLVRDCPSFERQSAEALIEIGKTYEDAGSLDQAIVEYSRAISDFPRMTAQSAVAKLRTGVCLATQGKTDKALQQFTDVVANYPVDREQTVEATVRIGKIYADRGQYDQAITEFQKVAGSFADQPIWPVEALLWTASTQEKAGRTSDSIASYSKLLSEHPRYHPQCAKASLAKGQLLEGQAQYKEALKAYEQVIKSYPRYTGLADAANARITALESSANLTPEESADLQQARTAYETTRTTDPLDAQDQAITGLSGSAMDYSIQRRTRVESMIRRGAVLAFRGQYANAVTLFRKVVKDYSDMDAWPAEALVRIGKAQRDTGDTSGALSSFASALATYPSATAECADAALLRGQVYEDLRDPDSALSEYLNVVSSYSKHWSRYIIARQRRAHLLVKAQRPVEAVAEWDQTLTDRPDMRPRILLCKGQTQMECRVYPDAVETLRTILSAYSTEKTVCTQARPLLVQALGYQRRLGEAMAVLDAMRSSGRYPTKYEQGLIDIWTALCSFPDYEKAEALFTKVISDCAGEPMAQEGYFHRSLISIYRGEYDKALADMQHVESPYLQHYANGLCHYFRKDWLSAIFELEQVLPSMPEKEDVSTHEALLSLVMIEYCYTQLGNEAQAAQAKGRWEAYRAAL